MVIVKVHRVFPSSHIISASSQKIQFHWVNIWDSREVVTPFMQDGTYPPRNFATLGPSELQPPFTEVYTGRVYVSLLLNGTGQVSNPIHHITISQSSVFLINSRSSLFFFALHCKAPLLPKLQGHFAEFLKCCYLNHRGKLNEPTCIGLVR